MPATPDIFALSLELLLESPHGVVLCGLSRPELNGKRGRCVGQVEGDIRLHVSVEGSEDLVQIRPSCLKIAPDPEQAEYEREYDQATKQQYAMHVARGQHAFTDGHLREAAEALVRAKQLCPKHPRACGLLGTTYQRMATEPGHGVEPVSALRLALVNCMDALHYSKEDTYEWALAACGVYHARALLREADPAEAAKEPIEWIDEPDQLQLVAERACSAAPDLNEPWAMRADAVSRTPFASIASQFYERAAATSQAERLKAYYRSRAAEAAAQFATKLDEVNRAFADMMDSESVAALVVAAEAEDAESAAGTTAQAAASGSGSRDASRQKADAFEEAVKAAEGDSAPQQLEDDEEGTGEERRWYGGLGGEAGPDEESKKRKADAIAIGEAAMEAAARAGEDPAPQPQPPPPQQQGQNEEEVEEKERSAAPLRYKGTVDL